MELKKQTPYERVGGREGILKVAKIFYDKVYAHPWIGKYFEKIPQGHIENQQTDFMSGALNGPKVFCGRLPNDAHPHMIISDELFDLRNQLLLESLDEAGIDEDMKKFWLAIDESFRSRIVNPDRAKAKKRYFTDEILDFENPETEKKKTAI